MQGLLVTATIFLFLFLPPSACHSQSNFQLPDTLKKLRVRNIIISGNKQTKEYIIRREMPLSVGDTVEASAVLAKLEEARSFIYNTTLFLDVKVLPLFIGDDQLDIVVHVEERWYIFPIPVFQLADRSVNEWIQKYNASLSRVSYGIRFLHKNVSGRNDQFAITAINGYSRNISFNYRAPYSNPSLTEGVIVDGGFLQSMEIAVKTSTNNEIVHYKKDNFVRDAWYARGAYLSRKGLKKRETFSFSFYHIKVDDSVTLYYPTYFRSSKSSLDFPEFEYRLQFINVDNILYPLKGYTSLFSVNKRGLSWNKNIDRLSVRAGHNFYFAHANKWYSSIRLSGEIKLPFQQAFINRRAIGYGEDYLRGYELYVIDAAWSLTSKFDVKKEIASFAIPTFLNSKSYDRIPFRIYAKSFADVGYAYIQDEYDSRLNNKLLFSGGVGLDIVTIYDLKLSIEFSLNQLRQKGLFLHY
ncbi:MAG: POTRA domain-containing protein [Ginsengibacter sp.]